MRSPPAYTRRAALQGLLVLPLGASASCSHAASPATASILDYLPAPEHAKIAASTSRFDCAPALQRAIDETAGKAILLLPAGDYTVVPAARLNHADPNFVCLAALLLRSGMHMRGTAATRIRIVDGFSTDDVPRAMAMFGSDVPLRSIRLEQLALDMNGSNNPISPNRKNRDYSRAPQAQIFVSGRPSGHAARIDDIGITACRFTGANGVSCIVTGQTTASDRLGRGWHISNCTFVDNGNDTDDHSSIYGYADDMRVEYCTFSNKKPFDGTGGNTCYEIHGSNHSIYHNIFRNYMRGIWVAENTTAPVSGSRIMENRFQVLFVGIDFFRDSDRGYPITDTRISGNSFAFDDTGFDTIPQLNLKAAVQIASEYAQSEVTVDRNTMAKVGDKVASAFVVVTGGAMGTTRHDRIAVTDNQGNGMTFGSFLRTSPVAGLGTISVTGNTWTNLTPAGAFMVATGDGVEQTVRAQPIQSLTLGGGRIVETRPGRPPVPAVVINGRVRNLVLHPGIVPSGLTKPLVLGGTGKIDNRQGDLIAR